MIQVSSKIIIISVDLRTRFSKSILIDALNALRNEVRDSTPRMEDQLQYRWFFGIPVGRSLDESRQNDVKNEI